MMRFGEEMRERARRVREQFRGCRVDSSGTFGRRESELRLRVPRFLYDESPYAEIQKP